MSAVIVAVSHDNGIPDIFRGRRHGDDPLKCQSKNVCRNDSNKTTGGLELISQSVIFSSLFLAFNIEIEWHRFEVGGSLIPSV